MRYIRFYCVIYTLTETLWIKIQNLRPEINRYFTAVIADIITLLVQVRTKNKRTAEPAYIDFNWFLALVE